MENDEDNNIGAAGTSTDEIDSQYAVNSLILDYYKKFGRKRDLEQFFSLSTAQGEVRDTSGLFWRKMKSENDSSDSGEQKSRSSGQELCRISIRCSMPEGSSSQSDDPKTKTESPHTASPPIITDDVPADISRHTDEDSIKSDDNHSQKSFDPLLDLSGHKPFSPTSSITSQRKLEWDSLADVGYANENDRKNSASSLSTLERLALKQQYSNNDSNQDIGLPTCHSTPVEDNEPKSKVKKNVSKKMTRIIKKDVDFVEVNLPHNADVKPGPSINVNLTKHISFNVEKDGGISLENVKKDVNVSPEKPTIVQESAHSPKDKEIQTSLPKTKEKSCSSVEELKPIDPSNQKIPVMISLNTLRKRLRNRRSRLVKRRTKPKKKMSAPKDIHSQEKSGEQLSEAESFEYMPGHMYNQNQMNANEDNVPTRDINNTAGNKSSLESSGGLTTDSSKGSKHSLTQDLEKCINVLKVTLQKRYDDSETKKKLIKDIVHRLMSSKYRDDDTSTEFLSGLSFNSKLLDLKRNNTGTSTSDANNTDDSKEKRPKKSILRMEKFDSNIVASTSQSAPNLYTPSTAEKNKETTSHTESDASSKGKTSSDNALPKTSSEQLYLKYLEALRREESYKKHLKDKEIFLKQKLASSVATFKAPSLQDIKINNRLKDLMKDLTRNNYDDGSGDASKLEGGSTSDRNYDVSVRGRNQRSHSVFTLSSSHSDAQKRPNLKKKLLVDRELDASTSKNHYCCCPHHTADSKVEYADSSVQVNIKYQYDKEQSFKLKLDPTNCPHCEKYEFPKNDECSCSNKLKLSPIPTDTGCPKCGKPLRNEGIDHDNNLPPAKYLRSPRNVSRPITIKTYDTNNVCVCNDNKVPVTDDYAVYQCSKLANRAISIGDPSNTMNIYAQSSSKSSELDGIQFLRAPVKTDLATDSSKSDKSSKARKCSQCSQTDMSIKLSEKCSCSKPVNSSSKNLVHSDIRSKPLIVHEATRCLQTEISINPRISDPSLSDIVIISNCVELIWEQERVVNRSNTRNSALRTFSDVYTSSESSKFLLRSGSLFGPEVKDSATNVIECNNCQTEPAQKFPNDYAIPIEGTNMTLVVSLAANELKEQTIRAVNQVDQGVGTERAPIAEQGTCIAAECAKSAQCRPSTPENSTRSSRFSSSEKKISRSGTPVKKPGLSQSSPRRSPQRNTYPITKQIQPNNKKPFRRSNTDTGKLETQSGCCQTEPLNIGQRDPVKPINTEVNTCANSCQVSETFLHKNTLRFAKEQEVTYRETKEIGTQKDLSNNEFVERQSVLEMVSRSVGSDVEPVGIIIKSCSKCGGDNKCICGCETNPSCNVTDKRKCGVCGNDDSDKCTCSNSNKSNSKESGCKLCGSDSYSTCKCGDVQPPSCRNEKLKECGCDGMSDCQHKNEKQCTPVQNKCVVCACEICQCDKKQISRTDSSKKISCGKCGLEGSCQCDSDNNVVRDPIMDMIKDITRRYSKNDITKIKKKKCFTEIITVLNYLLDTDDSTDQEPRRECSTPEVSDNYGKKHLRCKSPVFVEKHAKTSYEICKSPREKNTCFVKSPKMSPTRDNPCVAKKSMLKPPRSTRSGNTKEPTSESTCPCKHEKCGVLSSKSPSKDCVESSDMPCSTDIPSTSDSTACKILKKIKKECEKYHIRRNKCGRKCEISSSTSVNCDQCKKIHYCGCRHKCKRSKALDKLQKKCVAYNLILQTSESMLSEPTTCEQGRPLKNVIVKVPKCKDKYRAEMCKETVYKIEKGKEKDKRNHFSPRCQRSKSCPKESELSSTDDFIRKTHQYTVREYLEKNRPDFVEKCSERQTCLKYINEKRSRESSPHLQMIVVHQPTCPGALRNNVGGVPLCYKPCDCKPSCYPDICKHTDSYKIHTINEVPNMATERATSRNLLSLQLHREPDLTTLSSEQLRQLAQQIGIDLRRKKTAPKFISEHEMKEHSKNIYKTLPEVVQKKEEKKKENIKKTNLLMANIFKRNLQKNTLRGAVNISNYNPVIKI